MDLVKKVLMLSALGAAALGAAACAEAAPAQPAHPVETCVMQDVREEGRVASRTYTPGDDGLAEGVAYGIIFDNLALGVAMSPALATPERYVTVIETDSGRRLTSEREALYHAFEDGDLVAVQYVQYDSCDLKLVGVELLTR